MNSPLISLLMSGIILACTGCEVTKELATLQGRLDSRKVLDLSNTQTTDAELEQFKECTSLEYLCLRDTQITDAGVKHLKGLTNLEYLNLSNTQVTDTGLEHLKDLPNLAALILASTQITNAGLQRLSTAMLSGRFRASRFHPPSPPPTGERRQ